VINDVKCAVLSGGVGAAKLLRGLLRVVEPANVTAIVNIADDIVLHGLDISPDLDTVTYTLAGADNTDTGWGVQGETWQAMDMLGRYGGENWFNLGDRDLGTHLYRTGRLREGATLTDVTAEITRAWSIGARILPASENRIETRVTVVGEGEIGFQEYFVGRRHSVPVEAVRFKGADQAAPGPDVIHAITEADVVIIAPSNPIVSIGPLLAIPGISEALTSQRARCVAVSPIVDGKALKGPADRMMTELGFRSDVIGIAHMYSSIAGTLVIDDLDAHAADDVVQQGMTCVVTDTVMRTPEIAADLCHTIIGEVQA
jgi:LPPG:FO 2-phospho-L-lactate transferase